MEKSVKLEYTIYKYSSYSANYVPENILVNKPTDQSSRWFTDSNTPAQYLVLKLRTPGIVQSVTFGKYSKPHVSNLKQFRILGGSDHSNLTTLLSGGLKNDNTMETFQLRHTTVEGLEFPVLYLRIEPLQSWGPAYNYTIWYVQLQGIDAEQRVRSALYTINLRKEEEAVRILLKQLRRRRYKEAFEALSRETGVRLEGPAQARLWSALVESGDYERAETILEEAVQEGELDWYISWQPYTPTWSQISPSSVDEEEHVCSHEPPTDGAGPLAASGHGARGPSPNTSLVATAATDVTCSDRDWMNGGASSSSETCDSCDTVPTETSEGCSCRPGPRGGHQLVVDSTTGTLYLFGGWDGTVDLDDLWSYSIPAQRWTQLCAHSGLVGGPSPRSCHKMVLDPSKQRIYTLGRYLDQAHRVPDNMKSDLYVFDIASNEWSLVCADTAAAGGPSLVFDHQMCIDPDTQTIYVFGGRVLPSATDEAVTYSGLYAYYSATDTWQLLLAEHDGAHAPQARVGHSMLFHPIQRRLYIFAGQRNREHLLDLWWWDVETRQCGALAGACAAPRPASAAGFTQRATLDPDADEIYVLSGLSKEKDKRVCNALWVFSLRRGTWTCAYRNERASAADPQPRFAHQLVYDSSEKVHYLFGGNPGLSSQPRTRLDDLWSLRLSRPPVEAVVKRARAALREAHYRELVAAAARAHSLEPSVAAVHYLRHRLHRAIDHDDPEQVDHFKRLPTALFAGAAPPACPAPALTPALTRRLARRKARAGHAGVAGAELSRALAAVLGAEDAAPEPPEPFDDVSEPEAEPSDVGDASEGEAEEADPAAEQRAARIKLYDHLAQYFRPSSVPPRADVYDLVKL